MPETNQRSAPEAQIKFPAERTPDTPKSRVQKTMKVLARFIPFAQENRELSFRETQKLSQKGREETQGMTTPQIRHYASHEVPKTLDDIATSRIPLNEMPKTYFKVCELAQQLPKNIVAQLLSNEKEGARESDAYDNDPDCNRLYVAESLMNAVLASEGILKSGSSENRKKLIETCISATDWRFKQSPNLFGDNTEQIYNGIIARLRRMTPDLNIISPFQAK